MRCVVLIIIAWNALTDLSLILALVTVVYLHARSAAIMVCPRNGWLSIIFTKEVVWIAIMSAVFVHQRISAQVAYLLMLHQIPHLISDALVIQATGVLF